MMTAQYWDEPINQEETSVRVNGVGAVDFENQDLNQSVHSGDETLANSDEYSVAEEFGSVL
ncbi:hypothetical protein PsorP6_015062 [Peronosclerospora sorghi]|uniref:Uncharacterized protein n=1 Tax=Peronosclerospora sorghi TaxID=230839 RepID=A0ACC0VTY6_9STRA|nr:hypothetical protein PsorP6_015062 [Peronosclerospora sorghi]